MGSMRKRIGSAVLKSFVIVFLSHIISACANALFVSNMFEEDFFSERGLGVWHMIFFLMIFNSLVIAVGSNDKYSKEAFLDRVKDNKLFSHLRYAVASVDFYVALVGVTVISLILPVDTFYDFVGKAFLLGSDDNKLVSLLIILPIMWVILFAARVAVQRNWYLSDKKKKSSVKEKKRKLPPVVKSVLTVAVIYMAVSIGLPWLFPFFFVLLELGGAMIFVWIAAILLALTLITVTVFYIRAFSKRASFVKRIKKYCVDNSILLSDIKKPYASVVVSQSGFDFSVEKNGVKYDCKMIAGVFPRASIVFFDKGSGLIQKSIKIRNVELFRFLTKFEFGYESDGRRILILVPTPKMFYVSENQSSPRRGDVGERVGDYTIYNSTGFLNALRRDCL